MRFPQKKDAIGFQISNLGRNVATGRERYRQKKKGKAEAHCLCSLAIQSRQRRKFAPSHHTTANSYSLLDKVIDGPSHRKTSKAKCWRQTTGVVSATVSTSDCNSPSIVRILQNRRHNGDEVRIEIRSIHTIGGNHTGVRHADWSAPIECMPPLE